MKASKGKTISASKATRNHETIDFRVKMVKTKGSDLRHRRVYCFKMLFFAKLYAIFNGKRATLLIDQV